MKALELAKVIPARAAPGVIPAKAGILKLKVTVDAATGEAVADVVALLGSRDSCLGESFFHDPVDFASESCSGIRDVEEHAEGHELGGPATLTVYVQEEKVGDFKVDNLDAPFPFEFPINRAGTGTVRFEIQAADGLDRVFGLAADVRRPARGG